MMRGRALVLVLGIAGCSGEAGRVRDARDAFYSAVSRFDHAALRTLAAPEYLAVERGRLLNFDSLVADLTVLEQDSVSLEYAFADSAIRVDPPAAWLVYRGRKIVSRPPFADTAFTIESAIFRRAGGGWKLSLVHRTHLMEATRVAGDTLRDSAAGAQTPANPPRAPARRPSPEPAR
jgi:hypothetical protein